VDCEESLVEDHRTGKAPLPFAAVISASATEGHDDGPLRATLIFAGQTLVEYQARQAAEAGAGHISVHVGTVTPALSRSVDRLVADGINVALVRSPAELRQTVPPGTDILLVGDGIVAAQSCYSEMARRGAPTLLVINDHLTQNQFERIDARHRWAGLARLSYDQLLATLRTLDDLADWDLQSTLLRYAVQSGGDRILVGDEALSKGQVALIRSQAAADTAEQHFLPARSRQDTGQGWGERYIFHPLAERFVPMLLRQQVEPSPVRVSAAALAAIAVIMATYGITWPALLLFLVTLGAEYMADAMARVVRRPGGRGWTSYLCPALVLLGLAVLGSGWLADAAGERFTGIYLACALLIVELAIRTGKSQGRSAWTLCSLASALVLLLLFRLAGNLELGFAFVLLYALGSMAMLILTAVKPVESLAKDK
jgi:hypothetical protein